MGFEIQTDPPTAWPTSSRDLLTGPFGDMRPPFALLELYSPEGTEFDLFVCKYRNCVILRSLGSVHWDYNVVDVGTWRMDSRSLIDVAQESRLTAAESRRFEDSLLKLTNNVKNQTFVNLLTGGRTELMTLHIHWGDLRLNAIINGFYFEWLLQDGKRTTPSTFAPATGPTDDTVVDNNMYRLWRAHEMQPEVRLPVAELFQFMLWSWAESNLRRQGHADYRETMPLPW